jgi:biopolymer transport protein ExbD
MKYVIAIAIWLCASGCQLFGDRNDPAREQLFELDIDLPKAAAGSQITDVVLAVTIAPDGKMYANGIEVNRESLEMMVREEREKNPRLKAVIAADESVRYQEVVEIIDILVRNGVDRVSLGVGQAGPVPKPPPEPEPQ